MWILLYRKLPNITINNGYNLTMDDWHKVTFDYPQIPTMISNEEKKYLFWIASKIWTGEGKIVEIGPWLGGSTYCLCAGMEQNTVKSNKKLHVYDNFIWRKFMGERAPLPLKPGESFQEFFRAYVKDYHNTVIDYKQSLPDESIQSDSYLADRRQTDGEIIQLLKNENYEKTEILFIDGAKSWTGMKYLLNQFFDSFIPGKTLIVCQDYKYWGTYWVVIILEMLMDHFTLVHNLESNSTAFMLKSTAKNLNLEICEFDEITAEQGVSLLDDASQRLLEYGDKLGALILNLSKVRFLYHKNQVAEAVSLFHQIESLWPLGIKDSSLENVRRWLTEQLDKNIPTNFNTKVRRKIKLIKKIYRHFSN